VAAAEAVREDLSRAVIALIDQFVGATITASDAFEQSRV
jgi:hypothetical protein